eukprot:6173964-Pleurochrysis_carterae.AAC.1
MVSVRLPTPATSASFTSSRVEMLSLRRRTAFAIFSDKTVSGSCALAGRERLRRCIVCTNALNAVTDGSEMPRTSCECNIAEMVALVAADAAFASAASKRSSSLPLPSQATAYVRCAAWQVIVRKIRVIIF